MTVADELKLVVPESADIEISAAKFETWALSQRIGRFEWVAGKVIRMAPASFDHVDLNGWLNALLRLFVEHHKLGLVIGPELLVRLPSSRRVPDLLFVSQQHTERLKPTSFDGAPDLAIEIISNDSLSRDWREKYLEYEAAGVREYWVIDPSASVVEWYALGDDRRFHLMPVRDDKLVSAVLPGFYLRPSWLWQKPLPKVSPLLREMGVNL